MWPTSKEILENIYQKVILSNPRIWVIAIQGNLHENSHYEDVNRDLGTNILHIPCLRIPTQ